MTLTNRDMQRIEQAVRDGVDAALRQVFVPAVQQAASQPPAPTPVSLTGACQHRDVSRTPLFGGKVQCYCRGCHAQWTE